MEAQLQQTLVEITRLKADLYRLRVGVRELAHQGAETSQSQLGQANDFLRMSYNNLDEAAEWVRRRLK